MEANSNEFDVFFKKANTEFEQIAKRLMEVVLSTHQNLEPSIKWNQLTFALNNDFHHWICAINFTKSKVVLLFHFGGLLKDEKAILIAGTSKFLRKIEIAKLDEIDDEDIRNFIRQAIDKLPYFIENWRELNKKD